MEMAFSFCLTLFVLSSITCSNSNNVFASKDWVSHICPKTRNPSLCAHVLNSNTKARKASSLHALAKVTIQLAKSDVKTTKLFLKGRCSTIQKANDELNKSMGKANDRQKAQYKLMKEANDELKRQYERCLTNYDGVSYSLSDTDQYLKHDSYSMINKAASASVNHIIGCKMSFSDSEPLIKLKQANDKLECLCSSVLEISKDLIK